MCADPQPMLTFLRGRMTERKLRLFVCACCRRLSEWLPSGSPELDAAERFAGGQATRGELKAAARKATEWARACDRVSLDREMQGYYITGGVRSPPPHPCPGRIGFHSSPTTPPLPPQKSLRLRPYLAAVFMSRGPRRTCCATSSGIRSVRSWRPMGFLIPPSPLPKPHRTRSPQRRGTFTPNGFTILADALEEAGCKSEDILTHCRRPGLQARGCWVMDLLLNKS